MTAPRRTKAEVRLSLVAAARLRLAEAGWQDADPDAVAADAGVSPARLARHFPDRAALLCAVATELARDWYGPPPAEPPTDPLTRLQGLVTATARAATARPAEVRAFLRAWTEPGDPAVAAALRGFVAEAVEQLAPLLREGQLAGVFRRNLDPKPAAAELLRALLGLLLAGPFTEDDLTAGGTAGSPFDGLLHGLLKTDV
jgi:AcrR family transcriptional regulator